MDRRTAAYEPSLSLITLLLKSTGILYSRRKGIRSARRAFLFDMNLFFERVLFRFLRENLPELHGDGQQRSEARCSGTAKTPKAMAYAFAQARLHHPSRTAAVKAILDAKYIDLWRRAPSRDIVYQLEHLCDEPGKGEGGRYSLSDH